MRKGLAMKTKIDSDNLLRNARPPISILRSEPIHIVDLMKSVMPADRPEFKNSGTYAGKTCDNPHRESPIVLFSVVLIY